MDKPDLLIFDVNETLLDLSPLAQKLDSHFKAPVFSSWFDQLLQFAWAENLSGHHREFGDIGVDVLRMQATIRNLSLDEDQARDLLGEIRKLPPQPEVRGALRTLKEFGFRMVTLTNGGVESHKEQMEHAGLLEYFDATYSVESVQRFKPHPAPYHYVLKDQDVDQAMMVAAHAWDILGAQRAGLTTALLNRPGKTPYPGTRKADLIFPDLQEFANSWK